MTDRHTLLDDLNNGLTQMGLPLPKEQCGQLIDYLLLLDKWNQTYNLSAVRNPQEMVPRHLLDSLSLIPRLRAVLADYPGEATAVRQILDVGTGPGLPGIPLAICFPEHRFFLLDSNGKKTRFLFQAALTLRLNNVKVENSRIETYQSPGQLAIVLSRAFSSLAGFIKGCDHLCHPQTRLLAMKGIYPHNEITELPSSWRVVHSQALAVPSVDGQRHLIELKKNSTAQAEI